MLNHSEWPGIWLSVWRLLLTHCLYERAAEVLARPRGCAGSPEPSLLAYAISTKFAWRGPFEFCDSCWYHLVKAKNIYESPHVKTNKMTCAPSEDSDQPGHPPSLIRVFAVRMKKAWVLSYPMSAQRRLWSDWADTQADLSLRWAHMPFCWFCHEAAHMCASGFSNLLPSFWLRH